MMSENEELDLVLNQGFQELKDASNFGQACKRIRVQQVTVLIVGRLERCVFIDVCSLNELVEILSDRLEHPVTLLAFFVYLVVPIFDSF